MSASIQNRWVHSVLARNWATQLLRARVTRLSPWCISTCTFMPARSALTVKFSSDAT
ncbi:hypothetical protein D3C86_1204620 [compost metagenome]